MKLPFTTDEFFKIFEKYNLAVWPMQYVSVIMAMIAIFLAVKKTSYSSGAISLILSFLWLWMGAVYHLSFFASINEAAYAFGGIFIFQGILFLFPGFYPYQLSFRFKKDIYGITGGIFMLFALLVYPFIGYCLGHVYPLSPTFGLPCPTTIFTFGLMLWLDKKCPVYFLIIPLLWSVLGSTASISLGVKEDMALGVTGIIAFVMILYKNRKTAAISAGLSAG